MNGSMKKTTQHLLLEHRAQTNFKNGVVGAASFQALKVSGVAISFFISKLDIRGEFTGEFIAQLSAVFRRR